MSTLICRPASSPSQTTDSTMSTYFLGPFGRMLPAINSRSPENESRPSPYHSDSAPESHLYHLPPARAPGPLQFGSDPILRQSTPAEKIEFERRRPWSDMATTKSEQLPPVSQLLTPVSRSSAATSPYHPQPFTTPPAPSHESQGPYHFHRHDPVVPTNALPAPVQENPLQQQQPRSLPPISEIPVRRPDNGMWSHQGTHRSPPVSPFQNGRFGNSTATMPPYRRPDVEPRPPGAVSPADSQPPAPPVRPHVIDERYIEGEGLCYIYADGTYCPKTINGVPVNANWGITKAGRPRKRLAQACLTCREKKIKCHPNLPKCEQCQKSGRVCRFENAPRGSRKASQMESRPDAPQAPSHRSYGFSESPYAPARILERSTSLPKFAYGHTPDSGTSMRAPSVGDDAQTRSPYGPKKRRLSRTSAGWNESSKHSMRSSVEALPVTSSTDYTELLMDLKGSTRDDPLAQEWNADPYEVDPELTIHHVECYLTHVNDSLFHVFPRRRFLLWLKSCRTKSLDDKMLLYWMMTMGCVFSDRSDRLEDMKRYFRAARYAVEHNLNTLSLQLAQSRIIMGLWYYTIGETAKSWDAVGAAVRVVFGLRYNLELGGVIMDQSQSQPCEYGLHPQALIECRRRTFWAAFLLDRFSSFYSPSSTTWIPAQTAFLRLPCQEDVYEEQQYVTGPYFQPFLNKALLTAEALAALSPMAFLVDIMSLWSDVADETFRLSLIPSDAYGPTFEGFYTSIIQRSDEWAMKLPDDLTITAINMERSVHAKKANAFTLNHLFYHATLLNLNRFARGQGLQAFTVDLCIRRARYHAIEILRICLALMRCISDPEPVVDLNPVVGYLILSAVDVLSAAGPVSDLAESITLIRGGLVLIRDLARSWNALVPLASLIETRLDAMVESHYDCQHSPRLLNDRLGFIVDAPSLDAQILVNPQPTFSSHDLLYGEVPRERVLVALGVRGDAMSSSSLSLSNDNILWIGR